MSMSQTTFSHISINHWRQFEHIDIDLHPRLTVLTGANGSGKSTILSILEGNLIGGQRDQYLATPEQDKKSRKTSFSFSTLFSHIREALNTQPRKQQQFIGKIDFWGSETPIMISLPPANQIQYSLQFSGSPKVNGFKIGSHRAAPKYQSVTDIPVGGIYPKAAFDYFRESSLNYEIGNALRRGANRITNPISPLKQSLISFAIHGSSNENVSAVPELVGLFQDF
jgi:energy-coupling factor transporter ATP-binding protein EcfA2